MVADPRAQNPEGQPEVEPRARRPAPTRKSPNNSPGDERIGTCYHLFPYPNRSETDGFTLLELLVVIAVILVLIAIALPNFLAAKERAMTVRCKANLRVLGEALLEYKIDYSVFPPADGCGGEAPSPHRTCVGMGPAALGSWDGVPWVLFEKGYVTDRNVFYCPVLLGLFPEKKDYVRYAYNSSATDTGSVSGGADNLEKDSGDLWLCRCVWLPAFATFDPDSGLIYPHGDDPETHEENVMENVVRINTRVETVNGLRDFQASFLGGR